MGRFADAYNSANPYKLTKAQTDETYLEAAGRNAFELLDASSNLGRSAVAFAQTGDTEYLKNIGKIVTPFIESRKVDIKEITGSDNPYTNLFWNLAIDPLNVVGGVGTLTKLGKVEKSLKTLRGLEKVASTIDKVEDVTRLRTSIQLLEKESGILKKSGTTERALFNLGLPFTKGIDVGDAKSITSKIPRIFPESEKIVALKQQSDIITKRLINAKRPSKIAELKTDLEYVQDEFAKSKGVLPPTAALKASNILNWFKKSFSTKAAEPFIQTFEDALGIQKEQKIIEVSKEMKQALNELEPIGDITDKVFKERLLAASEARGFRNPTAAPDVQVMVNEAIEKANKTKNYKINRALKTGDVDEIDKITVKYAEQIDKIKGEAIKRELYSKKQQNIWDTTEPVMQNWVMKHVDSMYKLIDLENLNRVQTEGLKSSKGFTEYVPRVLSKGALDFSKKNKGKFLSIKDFIVPKISASYERTLLPELNIIDANQLIRDKFKVNFDYFETDVVKAMLNRRIQSIDAITSSQFVQKIAENYGTANRADGISLKAFYKKYNLNTDKLEKDIYVPQYIVNETSKNHKILVETLKNPESFLETALRINDQYVNRLSRVLLTVGFPEFYHRNVGSDIWLNMLGQDGMGLKDLIKYYGKSISLNAKRISGKFSPEEKVILDRLEKFHVFKGGISEDLAPFMNNLPDSHWEELMNRPFTKIYDSISQLLGASKKVRDPNTFDPLIGRAYGRFLEATSRTAHFLHKEDKGYSALQAMQSMNKHLIDYSDLTIFEQIYARPTVLFYTWMRKNIPLALKSITTNPRLYALYNNLTGSDTEDMPDYLRSRIAFPTPWNPQLMIAGLGIPIEDLNTLNVKDADPFFFSQVKRGMQKLASTLTPTLQAPTEIFSGEKHFSRKKLTDMGVVEYLNTILPTSRAIKTANELGLLPDAIREVLGVQESKKTPTARGIEVLTGIRTYTVDPKVAKIAESRRAALRTGKVAKFEILIPKHKFKTDEEVRKLIKKHRQLVENR